MIYRVNVIPIKIPVGCFAETDKPNLKFICKFKGLRIVNKTMLKMKNKLGGLTLPDFKTCYKDAITKTV